MFFTPILQRFSHLKVNLAWVAGLGLLGGLATILQAALLAALVNDVFLRHMALQQCKTLALWFLVAVALRAAATAAADKVATDAALGVKRQLRASLTRHVFNLGPVYLRTEKTGELVNTLMTGVEQLEVYISKYLPQVALAALIPLAIWVLVVGTDWLSAIILAVTAPLIPVFMILIGKGAQGVTDRQWRTLSFLSAHFLDVVRGLTTLKVFNRSKAQIEIIDKITENYRSATMKSLRIAFLSAFALELLTTLSVAMVAVALGLRLLSGHIEFYRAFLVLLLAPEFYLPIRQIGIQFHASMNGVSSAKRIFEILDEPVPGYLPPVSPTPAGSTLCIDFEHVSLTYPGERTPVLEDVSFSILPGETVAVVGPSGAGKSTLFDLLLGFIRPTSGRILVNGVPLDALSMPVWRQQIAYVPQRAQLLEGSIADTLRMGWREAPMEAVKTAAALAQADAFIDSLPAGYNTVLSEDVPLSGGQIQRLAIARAVLRIQRETTTQSSLLALDEPTAQLDLFSEHALQKALQNILPRCSALIVAHRLNTVRQADKVLVLQNGRLVQQGTHQSLISIPGTYRELYAAYGGEQAKEGVGHD